MGGIFPRIDEINALFSDLINKESSRGWPENEAELDRARQQAVESIKAAEMCDFKNLFLEYTTYLMRYSNDNTTAGFYKYEIVPRLESLVVDALGERCKRPSEVQASTEPKKRRNYPTGVIRRRIR